MRIALYWNNPYPLVAVTVRHDLYALGFERLGHDVVTACLTAAAVNFPGEVVTFDSPDEPRRPAFWKRIRPDLLVVVTWLSMHDELVAAREAGARVVAITDSDGQVGFGVHRRHQLYRSVMQHVSLRDRIGAVKYFGRRLLNRREESARILRSIEASDSVLSPTNIAVENVGRFLQEEDRIDLFARVGVCPYPVDSRFIEPPPKSKTSRMVAVGRWDSMQKDGRLLRDALARYCAGGGLAETHLFGAGMEMFQPLSARYPQVVCRGIAGTDTIAQAMSDAQILLLTSRWESGPIVAFEALCQGCTLVSTGIPNVRELVWGGRFGTIAASHSPGAFATAIAQETGRWERGERHPHEIAAHWRPAFSPESVCRRILGSLDAPRLLVSPNGSETLRDCRCGPRPTDPRQIVKRPDHAR